MYGIKKPARLEFENLVKLMKLYSYYSFQKSPGVCKYVSCTKIFSLYVEDFGFLYQNIYDANHLINEIKQKSRMYFYWKIQNYLGLSIY